MVSLSVSSQKLIEKLDCLADSCTELRDVATERLAYLSGSYDMSRKKAADDEKDLSDADKKPFAELVATCQFLKKAEPRMDTSFPHEFALLVPVPVLRKAAGTQKLSLREFVAKETEKGDTLVINPTTAPPNSHRLEKTKRTKLFDRVAEEAEYREMTSNVSKIGLDNEFGYTMGGQEAHAKSAASGTGTKHGSHQAETMSTFMKDIGIGIDMRLMSLAGAIAGYYMCYARGSSNETCIVGAAVGAISMMLVDGVLLIIRMSREDTKPKKKKPQQRRVKGAKAVTAGPATSAVEAASAEKKSK